MATSGYVAGAEPEAGETDRCESARYQACYGSIHPAAASSVPHAYQKLHAHPGMWKALTAVSGRRAESV
jgi:hypothetical protein